MSILNKIRSDLMEARRAKNQAKLTCLITLMAEASAPGMNDGKRDSTDAEVIAVCKKFATGLMEILYLRDTAETRAELEFIESYIPRQLAEEDIEHITTKQAFNSLGEFMKYLKENYAGLYDGKMASAVAKRILG